MGNRIYFKIAVKKKLIEGSPVTFLWLSQASTYFQLHISCFFSVQYVEVRGGSSFCWYWWNFSWLLGKNSKMGNRIYFKIAVKKKLIEGSNRQTHFWKRTIQWLFHQNFVLIELYPGELYRLLGASSLLFIFILLMERLESHFPV
jgi:hypothetical protein